MWQLQWSELEIERKVGRGSFGVVYRARWQETPVAVKVLIDRGALGTLAGLLVHPAACVVGRPCPCSAAVCCLRCEQRLGATDCRHCHLSAADTSLQSEGLELPDETMRELEAEAAVMIRMRHPNVVQARAFLVAGLFGNTSTLLLRLSPNRFCQVCKITRCCFAAHPPFCSLWGYARCPLL